MENTKELVDQIKKNMDQLLKANDQFLRDLPEDQRSKVLPIQLDIQNVIRAAKKGDINKINEISKRYADTNSK